jgi:hypothetical protein
MSKVLVLRDDSVRESARNQGSRGLLIDRSREDRFSCVDETCINGFVGAFLLFD